MPARQAALAAGIALGVGADALLGDPRRWHPVAAFGAYAAAAERALWRPARGAGVAYVAAAVAPVLLASVGVDRGLRRRPRARLLWVAAATWTGCGARSLAREARAVEAAVAAGDLATARERLPALCGRDPAELDEAGLRRAVVESVAENTSDAAVAPLLWAALAGPAGLLTYRAVNTLDAMVGHRSDRHARFGWAAARLDDAMNLLPARVTAVLAAALSPGRGRAALRAWRRDARAHPSPNAGVCEAAFAGALGVRLGGPTRYPYGTSARPWLGDGADVGAGDVARAVALSQRVVLAAASAAVWLGGLR